MKKTFKKSYLFSISFFVLAILFLVIGLSLIGTYSEQDFIFNQGYVKGFSLLKKYDLSSIMNVWKGQLEIGVIFLVILPPIFGGIAFFSWLILWLFFRR